MFEKLLAKRHIHKLNLRSVRGGAVEKLGWSESQALQVDLDYRRFLLALSHRKEGEMISPPTREVDEFWHQHILHTRQYREDCHTLFGHYIDHTPNLSEEAQRNADRRREEIYREFDINSQFQEPTSSGSDPGGEYSADSDGHESHSSHSIFDSQHHTEHNSHSGHDDSSHGGHSGDGGHGDSGSSDTAGDSGGDGGGGDGGGCGGGGCGG